MASKSPEQVIRDSLSAQRSSVDSQPVPGTTGWRAETAYAPFDAKPDTFHFSKVRRISHRQVHVVTFETQAGQRMWLICCVRRDKAGAWQFVGGAGGAVDGNPRRGHPWVNLGGGGPRPYYAGGHVLEHAGDVVRVRLRAANGTVLEDTVDDDVVLFLTDEQMQQPVYAELLDRSGEVVTQHRALG